jgi:hypothetical protein
LRRYFFRVGTRRLSSSDHFWTKIISVMGAEAADVRRLVVGDAGIGRGVGMVGGVLLIQAMPAITFGVAAADPFALDGAAGLPLLTAVAAS